MMQMFTVLPGVFPYSFMYLYVCFSFSFLCVFLCVSFTTHAGFSGWVTSWLSHTFLDPTPTLRYDCDQGLSRQRHTWPTAPRGPQEETSIHGPISTVHGSTRCYRVPGEIKRSRDLRGGRWSWTLTFAQKRS